MGCCCSNHAGDGDAANNERNRLVVLPKHSAAAGPATIPAGDEGAAHIRRIDRLSESEIRERWSRPRAPLPQYRVAADTICIAQEWLGHTRLGRHLRAMDEAFAQDPSLKPKMASKDYFDSVVLEAIAKGYAVPLSKAKGTKDAVVGVNVFEHMRRFCFSGPPGHLGGGKPQPVEYVTFALQVLAALDTPSGIVAKLSEVVDRTLKCRTAHNQAFNLLVSHSFHLRDAAAKGESKPEAAESAPPPSFDDALSVVDPNEAVQETTSPLAAPSTGETSSRQDLQTGETFNLTAAFGGDAVKGAGQLESEPEPEPEREPEPELQPEPEPETEREQTLEELKGHFVSCFEDYVDDHKEAAFTSAFIAPLRFYLTQIGDPGTLHNEEWGTIMLHGINWWLALVHSTLGMQLPFLPDYNDHIGPWAGVADYWVGMDDRAWDYWKHEDNFGKYQLGLPKDIGAQEFHRQRCNTQQLPHGFDLGGHHPKHLGNRAVDPGRADQIQGLVVYLQRFAYFFRAEFFVKRAFEIMLSETKAEHAGFQKTVEALYLHYAVERRAAQGDAGAEEMADTLVEEVYDEWFTELDVLKVQDFFCWLGVVKGRDVAEQAQAAAGLATAVAEEETIAEIVARAPTPSSAPARTADASLESYVKLVAFHALCPSLEPSN
jgi:hypothetical protein